MRWPMEWFGIDARNQLEIIEDIITGQAESEATMRRIEETCQKLNALLACNAFPNSRDEVDTD